VEWFRELYDDFRQRTGFGSIPPERTRRDVDFVVSECGLEPGDRVLDVCSGTGRHSIELERRGIHTVGFELNSSYVAIAEARAEEAGVAPRFEVGDVRTIEFGTDFDAAILMWNSFGYFSDPEESALLRKVAASLRAEGCFLIELLNRDFVLRNFEARSDQEVQGIRVVEEREFDSRTYRLRATISRFEGEQVVSRRTDWRLYSADELIGLAATAGLDVEASYGDLAGNPLTRETRLMRLVFRKRE
jgi:SAM-dependent methyltransferase